MLQRRSPSVHSTTLFFSSLLIVIIACCGNTHAFQSLSVRHAATGRNVPVARSTPSSTALSFMNWFGFNKDSDVNDQNKDSLSEDSAQGALTGVASIMESMDSYKRSQRIGKMTGGLTQELRSTTVEGVAENGKVKIILDCQQRPVSTFIDEGFLEATDASDVAAAVTSAMKDAHTKSIEKMDERMKNFFVELGLPSTN